MFVGQKDLPLSAEGEANAVLLASYLKNHFELERIVSSPLQRCRFTAQRIAEQFRLPIQTEERLKEMHFGRWQDKTLEEIFQENPKADLFFPPEGETLEVFQRRVESFLSELVSASPEKSILMVSHAGVNKIILMKALNLSREQFWELPQDYGALTEIYADGAGSFQIGRFNDRSYLEEE